jgi:hypothetical protein
MSGGDPSQYNVDGPAVRRSSRQLQQGGHQASQAMGNGVNSYNIGGGTSKTGKAIHVIMAGSKNGVEHTPGETSDGGQQNDDSTNGALDGMENLDAQNAALVKGASMDPDSIDQDAQKEAKDMLDGDKTDQQFEQILQEMIQMGTQFGQQASQQIGQLVNQLNQAMNQVIQQVTQAASQAATQAASHAASDALGAAGALGDGLGGAGDAGAGAGTIPAGMEEPVTPMTTSPALVQGTGPVALAASPASAAGARPPMMPMMPPMHGGKGDKDKRKRNPNIFPEGRIYEPPIGTVQNFGANPEIDAEAPPFGSSKSA